MESTHEAASPRGIRVCATCVHYRMRPAVDLFDGDDVQSPGALTAQGKWDEEQRQRAKEEMQRYKAGHPFEYEPHFYPWCAKFTAIDLVEKARAGDQKALQEIMEVGGATISPVSGEISPLFILCAWKNPDGKCDQYTPEA